MYAYWIRDLHQPTWPTKVRHKLHGQVTIFQDFILIVNSERLSEFLMSIGTMFQIFGAKYVKDPKPEAVVYIGPNSNLWTKVVVDIP